MPRRISGSDSEPDLVDELQSDAPDHESDSADSDGSERYWDGLKDLEGTHRTVYLHSIPESRKKYLEQKIAKLQGTIAQSAKESDVLILPEVKDKILWKKRHKRVKPVAWLEKRYSKLFDDDEERSAPRTKNSSKPWDPDHGPKFVRYMVEARLRGLNLRTGSTYAPLIKNESHNKNYRWAEGYTTDALKRRYVRRAEEFDHKIALEFLDRSPTDAPPTPEPSPGPIVRKRTQDVEDEEEQEFGDTSHR
ncbi:hypothetical protein DL93DRAFT_1930378 [Clavulina sp. PMI_390]|nr:hypothetical protein DL93DRAFT_1930378 [Clavulina sp. PMI_390]